MTGEKFWRDRSGYLWELVEGAEFTVGSYVRRVADGPTDISEGVQRIILYDPDGPVQFGVANERPSRAFRVALKDTSDAQVVDAATRETAADVEIARLEAVLGTANSVAEVIAQTEDIDALNVAKREKASLQERATQAAAAAVTQQAGIDALDRLGRDEVPIPEVDAEIARVR